MASLAARTPQRMSALERANESRIGGSRLKREVKAGLVSLPDALADDRGSHIEVGDLLVALPRWGRTKSRKALKRLSISEHRRVRELTERELRAVAALSGGSR